MVSLFLVMLLGLAVADDIPFESCEGEEFESNVMNVVIDPCNGRVVDERYTCTFEHDTTVKVAAAFTAPFTANRIETSVFVEIDGERIPFPETGQNPCRDMIPGCPLKANELYIFRQKFKIWKFYPEGVVDVLFGLSDNHGKTIACVRVPIGITKNPLLVYRD